MRSSLGILLRSTRACCAALVVVAACDSDAPVPSWPDGTVLAIGGEAISAEDVDQYSDAMAALNSAYAQPHRRRLVLTSITFPYIYGKQVAGERRAEARRAAEAWDAQRRDGDLMGPLKAPVLGNWKALGIDVWMVARTLEPQGWSPVVELPGQFAVMQLVDRDHASRGTDESFEVQLKTFPYVDRPEILAELCLEAELEIVDPEWDEVVPGFWKYKMRGDD